jgi:ribosomal protein S18 acetylase RimI-like enzyme
LDAKERALADGVCNNITNLTRASSPVDFDTSLSIASDAFTDPTLENMCAWICGTENSGEKSKAVAHYMLKWCSLHAQIVGHHFVARRDGSMVGAAHVLGPKFNMSSTTLNLRVMAKMGGPPPWQDSKTYGKGMKERFTVMDRVMKATKKKLAPKNYWHLMTLGVSSSCQGQGVGKQLLAAVARCADASNAAVYLETFSETSKSIYESQGYTVLDEIVLSHDGDETLTGYAMLRPPCGRDVPMLFPTPAAL